MRAQTLRLCLLVPLLALALRHAPAAAEEPTVSPADAYAKAIKALPVPAAAEAFTFTGVLRLNGKTMGYATLQAGPAAGHAGEWEAKDRFVVKGRAVPSTESSTARLTRQFALVAGTSDSTNAAKGSLTWSRSEAGFEVVRPAPKQAGGPAAETKAFAHKGSALNTMAATVLFCRMALPTPATYATHVFEPEAAMKGGTALDPVTLEVVGEQEVQGQKVLAVTGRKKGKVLTILFKPGTRELVALRLVEGETRLEILPGDLWVMPAPDAVTAGMRAMLALSAGQAEILDDVTHWPSLHAEALAKSTPEQRAKATGVEAWRTNMLAGYRKHLKKRPAAMMQQIIASMKAQIKQEKLEGGRVKVTFGPMLQNMQFVVAPFDGVWQLVSQPKTPKPPAAK